ncbi:hypothetical protein ACRAWD_05605 [Caulobacter segnis]
MIGRAVAIEHFRRRPVLGDTLAAQIAHVFGDGRGAIARAGMAHDPGLDDDPAVGPRRSTAGIAPAT